VSTITLPEEKAPVIAPLEAGVAPEGGKFDMRRVGGTIAPFAGPPAAELRADRGEEERVRWARLRAAATVAAAAAEACIHKH
jgi:hypothetical protein